MKQPDYQKRFQYVECWHVVTATGVAHVGSPERILIVDEAPPRSGPKVLGGKVGSRLADLFGLRDREELLEHVDALNFLPTWPGRAKGGKGDLFPVRQTMRELRDLRFYAAGVVLLGRVGRLFGFKLLVSAVDVRRIRFFTLPHPRNSNRWWNNKENVKLARKALEPFSMFARTGKWSR